MVYNNLDNVIDLDVNAEALAEAMGIPIKEKTTDLELLNGKILKNVRYLPQSIASSLEFDDGTPINPQVRKPKFNFKKWAREVIPKLNGLALKNIEIVNDLDGSPEMGPRAVRLSLISPGEFRRLNELCFPGAIENSDSEDEDNAPRGARGKGVRRGKSNPPSE